MGKIVVSQNVTLDGVVEDPSGEGGFRHGGWFLQFMGQDWEAWSELELAEAQGAEALLMGRRSDEYFGARSSITSGEWLDSLNRLPKYVVSVSIGTHPRFSSFPHCAFGSLYDKDAVGLADWAALRRPIPGGRWRLPG